jgi:hypothetical protein
VSFVLCEVGTECLYIDETNVSFQIVNILGEINLYFNVLLRSEPSFMVLLASFYRKISYDSVQFPYLEICGVRKSGKKGKGSP